MNLSIVSNLVLLTASVAAYGQTSTPGQNTSPVKRAPAKTAPVKTTPAKTAPKPASTKPAAATSAADPVVLSIGDEKMTKSQFEAFIAALPEQLRAQANGPAKRKFAEQFAEMKSLAQEARRRKLDQKPEVQERMALQVDNVLASEMFRIVSADVKVDQAAIQEYYDQHKPEYEQVKASHILIRTKGSTVPLKPGEKDLTDEEALAKAKDLREKLLKGADFATLAKAESDDAGSGANGGSLGTFGRGRMVAVFEQAAFSLPIGEVSEPLKSQFGYHLIKVEERVSKSLSEMTPQIEAQLKPALARKAVDEVRKGIPVTLDDAYFGK